MSNILVFAGPNGSGKSTITSKIDIVGVYTNADLIERELGCSSLAAAQNVEMTREILLSNHQDFTMETVLSTERYFRMMQRAKDAGYHVACVYVLTCDPEINVRRVCKRAEDGIQPMIDPNTVRKRYHRSLKMLSLLPSICDELYVFDNSPERGTGQPSLIIQVVNQVKEVYPNPIWPMERIEALLNGTYSDLFLNV